MHARLCLASTVSITRLSSIPVGVGHHGHSVAVRISRGDSPDKRGLTTRVDALSCRPEERSRGRMRTAFTQRCLSLKIYNIIGTD